MMSPQLGNICFVTLTMGSEWGMSAFPQCPPLQQLLEWIDCSEPYADSYARITSEYPHLTEWIEAIILPIQREIFGTE